MKRPWRIAAGAAFHAAKNVLDVAWIETDGERTRAGGAERAALAGPSADEAARAALRRVLASAGKIDVIGVLGGAAVLRIDAAALARDMGAPVVHGFADADRAGGGRGGPLAPAFHAALLRDTDYERPLAVLALDAEAAITWWGGADDVAALGPAPGTGVLDAWLLAHEGLPFDENGAIAAAGAPDPAATEALLAGAEPNAAVDGLSVEDAAATLTAFIAAAAARVLADAPALPHAVVVEGGGARNPALMAALRRVSPCETLLGEALGWRAQGRAAELAAFLAVRVLDGSPVTFRATTGVSAPLAAGVVTKPY